MTLGIPNKNQIYTANKLQYFKEEITPKNWIQKFLPWNISYDYILHFFEWDFYSLDMVLNLSLAINNLLLLHSHHNLRAILLVLFLQFFAAIVATVYIHMEHALHLRMRELLMPYSIKLIDQFQEKNNIDLPKHSQQKKCEFPQSTACEVAGGGLKLRSLILFGKKLFGCDCSVSGKRTARPQPAIGHHFIDLLLSTNA